MTATVNPASFGTKAQANPAFQAIMALINQSPLLVRQINTLNLGTIEFTTSGASFSQQNSDGSAKSITLNVAYLSTWTDPDAAINDLVISMAHEVGHMVLPNGSLSTQPELNPQTFANSGMLAEGVAVINEYNVAAQLGVRMHSDDQYGDLQRTLNDINVAYANDPLLYPLEVRAAEAYVATVSPSATTLLTYPQFYADTWAFSFLGYDTEAPGFWAGITAQNTVITVNPDASWSMVSNAPGHPAINTGLIPPDATPPYGSIPVPYPVDGGWAAPTPLPNGDLKANPYGPNVLYFSPGEGTATGGNGYSNQFIDAPGNHAMVGGTFGYDSQAGTSSWGLPVNTYEYGTGDGTLLIRPGNPVGEGPVTIDGVSSQDLGFQTNSAGDLIITDGTAGDTITIAGEFSTNAATGGTGQGAPVRQQAISTIITGNGNVDTSNLTFSWIGPATGSDYGNNAFTLDGSTTLVTGGARSNTYLVGAGTGTTTIASKGVGELTVPWDPAAPITYVDDASGMLTMTDAITGQAIRISGEYVGSGQATSATIRYEAFSDGSLLDLTTTHFTVAVAAGATISGTGFGTDTFILGQGTGTAIAGSETDDTFIDSAGNHAITGGAGTNDFQYAGGNGTLTITANAGASNTLDLSGIASGTVTYHADKTTGNLIVTDGTPGDTITILADLGGTSANPTSRMQFISAGDAVLTTPTGVTSTDPVANGTTASGTNLLANRFLIDTGGSGTVVNAGALANDYALSGASSAVTLDLAGTGRLDLGGAATAQTTWFGKSGNDLLVSQVGSTATIDIANWFKTEGMLGTIATPDGNTIAGSKIASLESTMASYVSGHAGFNPNTASAMPTLASLQAAIKADW